MATTAEFWKEYIVTDFKDFLAEQLQDPEILAEYQALESEYNRMQAMYKLQAELERGYQIGQKEGWLSGSIDSGPWKLKPQKASLSAARGNKVYRRCKAVATWATIMV